MTLGHFPDMMLKAHEQYNMGYKAANGSGNLCPIGENAAFCTGWYNNNGEDHECGDNNYNETIASHSLIGCPFDTMKPSQMIKPHAMIGVWDYVNGTYSGKIVYSDYGNFTLKIPNKTAFGDYKMDGSWGSMGPNILTECYPYGSCENNTLTSITPNHIEFQDNHGNRIHLMRGGTALNIPSSQLEHQAHAYDNGPAVAHAPSVDMTKKLIATELTNAINATSPNLLSQPARVVVDNEAICSGIASATKAACSFIVNIHG
jgi:hypothetical protein